MRWCDDTDSEIQILYRSTAYYVKKIILEILICMCLKVYVVQLYSWKKYTRIITNLENFFV